MVQEQHRRYRELKVFEYPPEHRHLPHEIGYTLFPTEEMCGYTYVTNHLCVSRDALVWFGFTVEDDGNNGSITFREGRNALAPIIQVTNFLANVGINFQFPHGVELDSGLFVEFTAHVTSATVFWRPRYEREAG